MPGTYYILKIEGCDAGDAHFSWNARLFVLVSGGALSMLRAGVLFGSSCATD